MSRRIRPAFFLLGAALVGATLVGARALTAGGNTDGKTANPTPAANGKATGPVVLGTVDSDTPPVGYGLPPVLQSGTVDQVFVKDGQDVKVGDRLYAFDTRMQRVELENARAAVAVAQSKVAEAEEGVKAHSQKLEVAKLAIEVAEKKEYWHRNLHTLVESQVKKGLKDSGVPEAEWPAKLQGNESLYKAGVDLTTAVNEHKLKELELKALQAADPQVVVRQARTVVLQAEVKVEQAKTAIEMCTVTARTAGTVEQVKVSPGSTLGISTRDPALWLIPAGPRIVRAEVEADFAHRVTPDLEGKEVTIYDHTDPKLTYRGVVRRVGGTFLPKRAEGLLPNDTRAIEVPIVVTDPSPAGKPPLRVGQRVRVNLGQ